jgi:hypothetical protein
MQLEKVGIGWIRMSLRVRSSGLREIKDEIRPRDNHLNDSI